MKKLFPLFLSAILMAVSCQHEEIWNELRDHEQRIEQLEKQCSELNSNVNALQTILTAIQKNDYVTEVMKVMENGVEIGYCITFAKAGPVNIYLTNDDADGEDDVTGNTPYIGIRKASDGAYYWTSGGDWLTDDLGNMIPATVADPEDGYITPQFRVVEGVWYVSTDNGNTWREIKVPAQAPLLGRSLVKTWLDNGNISSCVFSVTSSR